MNRRTSENPNRTFGTLPMPVDAVQAAHPARQPATWVIVASLLALSCLVQLFVLPRAAAPGLDAVRFAGVAQRIEQDGLWSTLIGQRKQPLFPVMVCLAHQALAKIIGEHPAIWNHSVVLAATLPLILAVVPVFLTSRRIFGPQAGLIGAVLFCFMPKIVRLGADGISDGPHLLLFACALWTIAEFFSRRTTPAAERWLSGDESTHARFEAQPAWLALTGALIGLAMLARAESVVLLPSLLLTLILCQFRPAWRQPLTRCCLAIATLLGCFLLVQAPYVLATGATTPRAAISRLLGYGPVASDPYEQQHANWQLADGRPMVFDEKDPGSSRRRGWLPGSHLFASELSDAYSYWIGFIALWGFWRIRRTPCAPIDWFIRLFVVLFCVIVITFVAHEGYIRSRHLATLVAATIGCAGVGLIDVARMTYAWLARVFRLVMPRAEYLRARFRQRTIATLTVAAILGCAVRLVLPVNHVCLGHRQAGDWLASQAEAGNVIDTQGWTCLFSGRPTFPYSEGRTAFADPKLTYIVVEAEELRSGTCRAQTLRSLLATGGEPAVHFAVPPSGRVNHDVVVYRWHPERFRQAMREGLTEMAAQPGRALLR